MPWLVFGVQATRCMKLPWMADSIPRGEMDGECDNGGESGGVTPWKPGRGREKWEGNRLRTFGGGSGRGGSPNVFYAGLLAEPPRGIWGDSPNVRRMFAESPWHFPSWFGEHSENHPPLAHACPQVVAHPSTKWAHARRSRTFRANASGACSASRMFGEQSCDFLRLLAEHSASNLGN